MNASIVQAIRERRILDLRYAGFSRVVEPHAYGRDKANDEILRCFQLSGGSSSGERRGWKLLKVSEIFSLEMQKDVFTPQPDYKRGDKAIVFMFEQL